MDHPSTNRHVARHVVDGSSDVLVVCHANITRSPLFAAYLAELWGARGIITVGSAGVRALVGSGPDPGSVGEANVRGLSLAHHVSRQVTPELVAGASLVLTMSERQREECVAMVPEALVNTFTVPEAVRLATFVGPVGLRGGLPGLASAWHGARMLAPHPDAPEDVPDPHGGPLEGFIHLGMRFDQWAKILTAGD